MIHQQVNITATSISSLTYNNHLDYCARGKSYVKVTLSVEWSWSWWLLCAGTLATYPSRRKNFELAAWSWVSGWSSEKDIFSLWAKNNLWQNLPGRMTFWCSSQQIGRAVGQGAFPLLPRYPFSEKAVRHFWPFLLFGNDLGVVILPNSKLLCVLMHGRSCSAWKDLTPLIHHFHSSPSANPVADTIKLQYNVRSLISTYTFNNYFMKQLLSLTIWMHEKKFSPSIFQRSSVRWLSSEWTPFAPFAVVVTSRAWKISLKHERIISVTYVEISAYMEKILFRLEKEKENKARSFLKVNMSSQRVMSGQVDRRLRSGVVARLTTWKSFHFDTRKNQV